MANLDIILPSVVLLLAFIMKLFVDQSATVPLAIETTYGLPVDIVFLALTFAAAFAIGDAKNAGVGLVHFAIYIGVAIISIVLSRRSTKLFDKAKRTASAALFLLNFAVSVTTLVVSVKLVSTLGK